MTLITVRTLSREQFVHWMSLALAGAPVQPEEGLRFNAKDGEVMLAWPEGITDARPIVCLERGKFRDFFAFVSTYFGNVQPYTAYFRVLPLELLESLKHERVAFPKSLEVAKIAAGASIAEAWLGAAKNGDRATSVVPPVRSTLSSVLGQCVLAGYEPVALDWVLNEWLQIRSIGQDIAVGPSTEASSNAWQYIHAAISRNGPGRLQGGIVEFLSVALDVGTINGEALHYAARATGSGVDLRSMLVASREERVGRFNKLLSEMKSRRRFGVDDEFLAGLMLAIAGNGSFDMLRSAREFEGWLDGAATWFGVCASLFEESNVLGYAHSVGRRMVRDILVESDLFGMVSADISSTELRFISSGKADLSSVIIGGSASIDVEILPNVVSRLALRGTGQAQQRVEDYEVISGALDEIVRLAERARKISRRSTRDEQPMSDSKGRSKRPNRLI
ncbi:hypothetical protein [Rhizobium sp. PP-CC-3G-465]|uniref:hypothetical protein n=1 Tax=Rhizobium sp. PP-CC-3G-465 TaxID=2135648 RepID=UPI0010456510|nr:hypothetical protein C8J33_1246 [Rhizobium sp. PP-CC-3G-465]